MTPLKWSGGSSSKPSLRIKSPSVNKQTEVLRMGSHAEDFSIYIFGLEFRKAGGAGKGSTSRIFGIPVTYMMSRSKPRPKPAWRAPPKRRRSRYHQ